MFRRFGQFAGGIDLPEEKHNTLDLPVSTPELPDKLYLDTKKLCLGPADVIVTSNQSVAAGQMLARAASSAGVDLFSPADATVGWITHDGVIVLGDIQNWAVPVYEPRHMIWQAFPQKRMRNEILRSNIVITRKRCEAVKTWLQRSIDFKCSHLILNAMETQPGVTSEHRTLVEFGEEVIQGLVMICRAGTFRRMTLVVDSDRTSSYSRLLESLDEYKIEHLALPRKYPLGEDPMLLKVVRRREIPLGKLPCSIGVSVIDPWTCMCIYRLMVCEQRLSGRIVTISGQRLTQSGYHNYYLPYGMKVGDVLKNVQPPIIKGGLMNGRLCDGEETIDYTTDALLAIEPEQPGQPTQCIRCGWCSDHCPARLNVAALNDAFELSHVATAARLKAMACVNCGICSYVCPARLPLRQRVQKLARAISGLNETMPLFSTFAGGKADE